MREVTGGALELVGILRDDPSTWTKERPDHLQHLKANAVFDAVGTKRTLAAIDAVVQGQPWTRPLSWGAFSLVFPVFPPSDRRRGVPADGWHCDAAYTGPLAPPMGVKVHAMFGNVAPRSGGMNIISGSHRLVHQWFLDHPPPPSTRAAKLRRSLHQHPYLAALCTPGDEDARIARFHDQVEDVGGIPLQVVENTAAAGDVILMHPLLLHAPPVAHTGTEPRFLLNKDLYLGSDPR